MVIAYVWFTIVASQWRIAIRRVMNDSDTDANSKAIDSLLNYETVKYFNNERMETERFDRSMATYEGAAIRTYTSLAWLNMGQTVIFTIGMTVLMVMSARAVLAGEQTLGDFVMVNALLMQLSIPLNFIGFVYREIKLALADIEAMFAVLALPQEVTDKAGAAPLTVPSGTVRFDNVVFTTTRTGRSCTASPSRSPPGRRWRSSARPAPASRPSRACSTGSTTWSTVPSRSTGRTSAT